MRSGQDLCHGPMREGQPPEGPVPIGVPDPPVVPAPEPVLPPLTPVPGLSLSDAGPPVGVLGVLVLSGAMVEPPLGPVWPVWAPPFPLPLPLPPLPLPPPAAKDAADVADNRPASNSAAILVFIMLSLQR